MADLWYAVGAGVVAYWLSKKTRDATRQDESFDDVIFDDVIRTRHPANGFDAVFAHAPMPVLRDSEANPFISDDKLWKDVDDVKSGRSAFTSPAPGIFDHKKNQSDPFVPGEPDERFKLTNMDLRMPMQLYEQKTPLTRSVEPGGYEKIRVLDQSIIDPDMFIQLGGDPHITVDSRPAAAEYEGDPRFTEPALPRMYPPHTQIHEPEKVTTGSANVALGRFTTPAPPPAGPRSPIPVTRSKQRRSQGRRKST
jgi:hypothetical protein